MTANSQKINAKSVFKYMFLPGIIPRAKELGGSGFGYLAFMIASVFQAVRILPQGHPYLNSANIGKYSLRAVLAAAANNIEFNRKNIDQIMVFGAVVLAMVLLVLQFALFLLAIFTGKAFAQDAAPFKSIFVTENPKTDVAFLMLDYVFGIPKLFGSAALGENGDQITPFHQGLHDLFQFYNMAILVVAVFIFMYYVIVVVVETAQTGVPFGRRFSKIYAPFRLIAAVGLLVPLNYGFNGAQYITFYAAKLGSSMATNGWILYNSTLENPLGVSNSTLIGQATPPEVNGVIYFATVYHACREMYKIYVPKVYTRENNNPVGGTGNNNPGANGTVKILPYVIVNGQAQTFIKDPDVDGSTEYSYDAAKKYFKSADMEIVLGELDTKRYTSDVGHVRPYCGKMTVSLANQNPPYYTGQPKTSDGHTSASGTEGGVNKIESAYYYFLQSLFKTENNFAAIGERAAHANVPGRRIGAGGEDMSWTDPNAVATPCWRSGDLQDEQTCGTQTFPSVAVLQPNMDAMKGLIESSINIAVDDMRKNIDLKLTDEMKKQGWGGAGVWYDRIAEMNGSVTAAIYAAPTTRQYPQVLEAVANEKKGSDTATDTCATFDPNIAGNKALTYRTDQDDAVTKATNAIFKYWGCDHSADESPVPKGTSGNVILDVIGVVFGLNGLFHLQADTTPDKDTGEIKVHPLAALSAIGKGLLENAIRSMAISVGASFGGGMQGILGKGLGLALNSISKMFMSVATLGLTAGFILYYILPFMPFIYFFFAVGSWVKSIFEAMVGAPLWALAHLRIDGDGFSGKAAAGGYFLIFEIFIRPIATVFGLIGGMAVFSAMVSGMNSIFTLIVINIVGDVPSDQNGTTIDVNGDPLLNLGTIDQFFFTVVYAILVYMMATASFKMIDTIPKQIMRWMGTGVNTFNDNTGDPTANLTQYTGLAGSRYAPQIFQGMQQGAGAAGNLVNALAKPGEAKTDG